MGGSTSRLTFSNPELTQDHVLQARMIDFSTVGEPVNMLIKNRGTPTVEQLDNLLSMVSMFSNVGLQDPQFLEP